MDRKQRAGLYPALTFKLCKIAKPTFGQTSYKNDNKHGIKFKLINKQEYSWKI